VTDVLYELAPHIRSRLAAAIETGTIGTPYSPAGLMAILANREAAVAVVGALGELERKGIAGKGAAAWLRMLDTIGARVSKPDLVWSGPGVPGVHARDTRRVYEELISTAQRSVWACSYAYFDGHRAFEALATRMDEVPALSVNLLLNIQRKKGDTSASDEVVRRFTERFWGSDWPGTRRPQVFYDPRSLDPDGPGGVLHAKGVVADEESVFVTSANFTEAALDRNIEMGILVRDRALALSVVSYFVRLIEEHRLRPLPAS
jgi:phosphatidylserine/phosphatidylglycerophosphate/cardiolipin synthase-like enzyme